MILLFWTSPVTRVNQPIPESEPDSNAGSELARKEDWGKEERNRILVE